MSPFAGEAEEQVLSLDFSLRCSHPGDGWHLFTTVSRHYERSKLLMNRQQPLRPHTIAIAGANGMVGRHLVEVLLARGDRVIALVRTPASYCFPPAVEVRRWQASDPLAPVDEADAVVNLVGSPIFAQRWTQTRKQELIQTRVLATYSLVEGLRKARGERRTFISST